MTEVAVELPQIASVEVMPGWVLTHVNGEELQKAWVAAAAQLREAVALLPDRNAHRTECQPHRSSRASRRKDSARQSFTRRSSSSMMVSQTASQKTVASDILSMVPATLDLSLHSYEGALVR